MYKKTLKSGLIKRFLVPEKSHRSANLLRMMRRMGVAHYRIFFQSHDNHTEEAILDSKIFISGFSFENGIEINIRYFGLDLNTVAQMSAQIYFPKECRWRKNIIVYNENLK